MAKIGWLSVFWVKLYCVVDVYLDGLPIFVGVITHKRSVTKLLPFIRDGSSA
jgi:hypothetical protein